MSGSILAASRNHPRCFNRFWHRTAANLFLVSISILLISACGKDNPTGTTGAIPYKVIVTPDSTQLATVEQTVSLTASVQDKNGVVISGASVSWHSKDDAVAKVNPDGLVRALGYGATVITATSGQVQGYAGVTVTNSTRAVLQTFYDATGGENWTNSSNWLSDEPVGEWYGVLDGGTGLVVGLQSSASSTGLERLDLSNNQLVGQIPPAIGNLSDLRYLDLSENSLNGDIPAALGNLSKLETLRLFDNQLSGEIPSELGNLSNLRELSLHDNADLEGALPLTFTNLDTLETLSLSGTLLCAPTDSTFQSWLEGIENKSGIVNCGDDTVLDQNILISLYNATDGINWKTSTNWLTEEPLDSWYGVSVNLEGRVDSLILEENDLNGIIPVSLGKLADIQMLDLSDNELSGSIPIELGNLTSLVMLDLSNNMLSGEIPFEVIGLPNLKTLDLSGNQFAGLPSERDVLIAFYNATGGPNWRVSTNWLSEEPIELWYGVTSSEDGSVVTGITLDFNNLAGGIPPELGQLTSLRSLDLEYNDLSGEIPTELGSLTSLVSLDLSDNEFTGEIPPEIGQLTDLVGLDLSWNDLTGQLPLEMTQLVNLTRLYLQVTSVCAPRTAEFQDWISGIRFSRVAFCIGGTAGNAPADQTEFDTLVTGMILSVESYYIEFDSGSRFTETGEYEGNYTYTLADSSTGAGILTLNHDEGAGIDSCTVELFFVQTNMGSARYKCDDGILKDSEQWRLEEVPDPDNFDIEIVWVGNEPGGTYRMAFDSAVERWESIITSDVDDEYLYWYDLPLNADDLDDLFENGSDERIYGYVDDLRIYVQLTSVDGEGGLLGLAGVIFKRSPSNLPLLSAMILDTDDLDDFTTVAFQDLVMHEIGHALGFGTVWEDLDLLKNPSLDFFGDPITPAPDTHFSGVKAISAFNSAGGASYTGAKVPVENEEGGSGTRDGHWRNSVIGPNELMDGFGDPAQTTSDPLSLITIESMADLGYTVDVTQADSYMLPSDDGASAGITRRSDTQIPLNCFSKSRFQARVIERTTSIVPLFEREVKPSK